MKINLNNLYKKVTLAVTIAMITFLNSPTFAFAQEEGGGTDIGGMITNVANYLANNLQLALSGVAIVAIVANVLFAMFVGGDELARLKGNIVKIIIAYAVGMAASTIIQTISNAINGGGSYG